MQVNIRDITKDTAKGPTVKQHSEFYFADGNAIFLVEDVLFNVHRYFLHRDSPVFRDLFLLPQRGGGEGQVDNNPIRLDGTRSIDMERFLSILYPPRIGHYDLKTTDEWASVLELAHKWQFDSICELVADRLPQVASLVDQIILGRRYGLEEMLLSARVRLCEREAPISLEEGRRLGLDECIVVGEVRQKARSNLFATTAMKFDEWDVRMLQEAFQVLDT
ncbi:uncharacterized protein B0H18DRAFT_18687 [Fomitopsis serialis]|uniref:uncharacterized protein n=1 Tax=Fomitopsis serialis TaxID=139415 RepID=UPI002008300F|nr:uncharacterized protein B0H18DRAFT_18687 [Neoantrodia serialis]KAH9938542.1 hypothetical protein B0H18DRAFT_18687 [Neoantrodia serialis]